MPIEPLTSLLSADELRLFTDAGGEYILRQMGVEVLQEVILNVLSGRNLRDSTEVITRRRLSAISLAVVNLFLRASSISEKPMDDLLDRAVNVLANKGNSKTETWLAQWLLGLTSKGIQNILRDDVSRLSAYRQQYVVACEEIAEIFTQKGAINGTIKNGIGSAVPIDWLLLTFIMNAIGSQTLTIRGSEKSAYGKLFEKLILGSLLHMLGFQYISASDAENLNKVYWLSSRESKRESDATLLYEPGKGVRFDIGFIGRGNPEISLDKVSRFERHLQLGRLNWYMATFILVDTIPPKSRLERMAKEIEGTIIQMSGSYWPQQVARELHQKFGFEHDLLHLPSHEIEDYLNWKIKQVPFTEFIQKSKSRPNSRQDSL